MAKKEDRIKFKNNTTTPPRRRMGGMARTGGGPMQIAEKPKNFKRAMKRLLSFCKPYLPAIIFAIVFACLGSVVSIIGPDQVKNLTNAISSALIKSESINIEYITKICLILAILYVSGSVLSYVQTYIMATTTQKISKDLRTNISQKINRLPLKFLDNSAYGDTLSRITNDVDSIASNLNNCVASLVSAVVLLLGVLVMMFITNYILAICAIFSTLIGFAFMRLIIAKSQKYFAKQQEELGNINGYIEEAYSGHTIVKVSNAVEDCKREFNENNNALYNCSWKAQFYSGLMGPLMQFMGNFGFVVVCIVGAVLCASGKIEIGTIVAFIIYVRMFSSPLNTIGQSATSLQTVMASAERVFEILDEEELEDESGKIDVLDPRQIKGSVEFSNVNFGYVKNVPIIKDFSVSVKPGQKVAIVGQTGAGKTTIVNLLMRFYEIDSGSISIDGVNIADITRENLHELFAMVLQDTWVFNGTIRENIVYDKPELTDEQVEKVLKEVEMWHTVQSLPNGMNTKLNEYSEISVGQRQLLTIARAMIVGSPMLILDEATSSVDTRTELQIQRAMDKLMQNKTSFVIAHRLSTIKNADLILVLDNGNIVEKGTHDELMQNDKGYYYELYQASSFE